MIKQLNLTLKRRVFLLNKLSIKQFVGAAGLQAIQMTLSALIGFIIIRTLSKENFAIFNLLNIVISTLTTWASFTITTTFIPFANRMGANRCDLFNTTAAFQKLNFPFLVIGIFTSFFLATVSAYNNGWISFTFVITLFVAILVAFNQYSYRFPESAYKVSGKPLFAFNISIRSDVIRLVLTAFVILIIIPNIFLSERFVPLILMLILFLTTSLSLRNIKNHFSLLGTKLIITKRHKKVFWYLLKPLLFPEYFYHLSILFRSGVIYLISGSAVIAEAAAIGRLMVLFAMMDKAVELVILPKLGVLKNKERFLLRLSQAFLFISLLGLFLICTSLFMPDLWLIILGEKYSNLEKALPWAVAAALIERLSGLVLYAQLARGETKNQWWIPVLSSFTYFGYVFVCGLDSAEKATIGLFVSSTVGLLSQLLLLFSRYKQINKVY